MQSICLGKIAITLLIQPGKLLFENEGEIKLFFRFGITKRPSSDLYGIFKVISALKKGNSEARYGIKKKITIILSDKVCYLNLY